MSWLNFFDGMTLGLGVWLFSWGSNRIYLFVKTVLT